METGYIIKQDDKINSFLVAILRELSHKEMAILRDNIDARIPKETKQKLKEIKL